MYSAGRAPSVIPALSFRDATGSWRRGWEFWTGVTMRLGACVSVHVAVTCPGLPLDFVEENVQRFLCPERSDAEFESNLARAQQLPIQVEAANAMFPSDLRLVAGPGLPIDGTRVQRYARTAIERAGRAGILVIVFGSGAARARPDGVSREEALAQLGEHLAAWSVWAEDAGIVLALEPLRCEETNIVNTIGEGGRLVQSVARPGVGLLVDLYHAACNGEAPESVLPFPSILSHVHVAEMRDRSAPGRYGEDFRPWLSVLHKMGYDGRISLECAWQDFATEAGPAIAALRAQWNEAALMTVSSR